jgi:hypothetical protein
MKKIILLINLFLTLLCAQTYDVGDVISENHQNQSFDICYGDDNSLFQFSDLNGALNNDGKYWITFIDMAATW